MTYSSALNYLFSFLNFERIPFEYQRQFNLRRIDLLLRWFDSPQYLFPSILIAGTKGKGSTANFLSHIVTANGYKTGLYTSPHLTDPRERIRINGKAISKQDFARLVSKIHLVVRRKQHEVKSLEPITFFEIFTLLAVLYFADQKIDLGVFEVGMGGRLDATNILNPLISIITSISYDHEEHLGHLLKAIAGEKAAIIKKGGYVISADQAAEAGQVIKAEIRKQKAKAYFLGDQFKTLNECIFEQGGRFDFQIGNKKRRNFTIPLTGRFQIKNAALALEAASILENHYDFEFKEKKVRAGLQKAFWPGRFERIQRLSRTFVLDGAHNGASMEELGSALKQIYRNRPMVAIFGTSKEKVLPDQLKALLPICSQLIITKSSNPRAQDQRVILNAVSQLGFRRGRVARPFAGRGFRAPTTFLTVNIKEAIKMAHCVSSKNAILVITGSLFLIGDAREILKCRKFI